MLKRVVVGKPLRSDRLGETELPKWLALPVFCSDPLSSVAYATEEILLVLGAGGLVFLTDAKWVMLAICTLLVVVVASYRQTVHAYPSGGGDYVVAQQNLGPRAGLFVGTALLVDYVLTVAVSVVAGVAAITSAAPSLRDHRVIICIGFVVLLTLANLRGVKESGKAFAVPTYGFVLAILTMFGFALYKLATGAQLQAESADLALHETVKTGGWLTLYLVLRAFASGCTALTGVEAISTGVPVFRKPKSRNAGNTLVMMAVLSLTMFVGITLLAIETGVRAEEGQKRTVLAQITAAAFGGTSNLGFYVVQAFTAGILILAANTAFNGFPILGSILAQDSYLPKQLRARGDRLVFSNGVVLLASFAILLIVAFDAEVTRIIQLYIIGVFIAFSFGQTGMVIHWSRLLSAPGLPTAERARLRRIQAINFVGASVTGIVLVIVTLTKFTKGAYIVFIAMPIIFMLMSGIKRHYDTVAVELQPDSGPKALPTRVRAIVLVSKLHRPTLRAVAYAVATHPYSLEAVTVSVDDEEAGLLAEQWQSYELLKRVPLRIVAAPYRDLTDGVLDHVRHIRAEHPGDLVVVYIPEYVVGRWWEQLLHNQAPLRLKARLLFERGVMVTSVPFQLGSDVEQTRADA
jgi:amino acid transporter